MASPSSPPKSDSSARREDMVLLLRDGSAIRQPTESVRRSAVALERLGLIAATDQQYVRCADPQDSDFRFTRNRSCRGKVYLYGGLDEAGQDYRCPDCERPVFPRRSNKRRHSELRIALRPDGVHDYVATLVSGVGEARSLCRGMFRVERERCCTHVCVADICGDERYLARAWAQYQPTLYMTVDEHTSGERFLPEDWVARVALADAICGAIDLGSTLIEVARQGPPLALANISVPVYRTGPPLIGSERNIAITTVGSDSRAGPRTDGVYPPRTIVYRGVVHDCELTSQEVRFLNVALMNQETDIGALMHSGHAAIWHEPYTKSKRNKISQFLTRVNAKLLSASPPLRVTFTLRRGMTFVSRVDGPPPKATATAAR